MIFDFCQQLVYAGIFFLGLVGIGILILRVSGYQSSSRMLTFAVAYFASLCLYTLFLTTGLLILEDKHQAVVTVSLLYFVASWAIVFLLARKRIHRWIGYYLGASKRRFMFAFLVAGILITFLFFLQVYHTAILDEWLHRPVVTSFVQNGIFPLVNPYSPGSDYIHTYHYGTQVIGAALTLLSRLDVSSGLDLFKMSVFIATFFLFYGMISQWVRNKYMVLAGAVLVLFSGSSFFLLDSFTINHLISFDGFGLPAGQRWPINASLAYILTGITWANIPLAIAMGVLVESIFLKRVKNSSWAMCAILAALFVGFFLISELFAVIVLVGFLAMYVAHGWKNKASLSRAVLNLGIFSALMLIGVYLTGGIVGDMLAQTMRQPFVRWRGLTVVSPSDESASSETPVPTVSEPTFLSLKSPSQWGYPSEKRVLVPWDIPFYYLRSVLFEVLILILWGYLLVTKRVRTTDHPVLVFFIAVGLIGPFFLTTKFGDLNFAKTTTLSFVILHLLGFYLLSRLKQPRRVLSSIFLVFLVLGSVSGLLMGPNIQWQIISGKGRDQYCSQNPLCYKGPLVELLRRFEAEKPGLKRIGAAPKDVNKVIDLTQSYVYGVNDSRIAYIVETPELRVSGFSGEVSGQLLYEIGEYRIWKVN